VPIPGSAGAEHVEYYYQLLDEHQNRVLEKGRDNAPEVFQLQVATAPEGGGGKKLASKWLAVGVVGEVLGVVGIAGGIGAYFAGKNAADRWNNDSVCLAGGRTRAQNCSSDRSAAQAGSSGAIASFTIGGVLIVASTILLIAAPRSERDQKTAAVSCGDGPGVVGVACGVRF